MWVSALYHTNSGLLISDEPGTNHLIQNHVPNLKMQFGNKEKDNLLVAYVYFHIYDSSSVYD